MASTNSQEPPQDGQKPLRPVRVLSVGLPRTGSYSMSLALSQLGYKDVYHCMHTLDNPSDWMFFGEASDRLFPTLPTYNGKGMEASDWDEIFGHHRHRRPVLRVAHQVLPRRQGHPRRAGL